MATVLVGAVAGSLYASTAAAVTLSSVLTYAAIGGALAYGAESMIDTPGSGAQVQNMSSVSDKTMQQQAAQLDAAKIGDEESEKRKRKSAKSKFKIKKDPDTVQEGTTGVALPETAQAVGVQL